MVGLPKQDWQSLADTVEKVVLLKPEIARIYPLLVIKDTPLEKMYRDKVFFPLSLSAAVAQASYVYERLTSNGIEVIRIGLQADEELCKGDNIVAGPFHPSFGELVKSFQYRCWVAEQLEELDKDVSDIIITHNSKMTSQLKGIKKCNEEFWQRIINKQDIKIMALKAGLFFGIFQALMPFLGFLGGIGLREYIQGYDKIVAFVLLLLIGGKMLYEAFTENIEEEIAQVTNKLLLTLAIATSLDAMAAGYSLHLFSVNVYLSIFIIGIITFIISYIGVYVGSRGGEKYESKAEILGGVVLILIGFKILLF